MSDQADLFYPHASDSLVTCVRDWLTRNGTLSFSDVRGCLDRRRGVRELVDEFINDFLRRELGADREEVDNAFSRLHDEYVYLMAEGVCDPPWVYEQQGPSHYVATLNLMPVDQDRLGMERKVRVEAKPDRVTLHYAYIGDCYRKFHQDVAGPEAQLEAYHSALFLYETTLVELAEMAKLRDEQFTAAAWSHATQRTKATVGELLGTAVRIVCRLNFKSPEDAWWTENGRFCLGTTQTEVWVDEENYSDCASGSISEDGEVLWDEPDDRTIERLDGMMRALGHATPEERASPLQGAALRSARSRWRRLRSRLDRDLIGLLPQKVDVPDYSLEGDESD